MQHLYTARFLRSLKKLSVPVQEDVVNAIARFECEKYDDTLKLHKLHGKFKSYHAFSANFSHRIILNIKKETIYYMDIGTHDIYK